MNFWVFYGLNGYRTPLANALQDAHVAARRIHGHRSQYGSAFRSVITHRRALARALVELRHARLSS